jgi:anti-sigma regulatory factor (Ser/Thr protein kinase)
MSMNGNQKADPRLRSVLPFEARPAELRLLRRAVRTQLDRWGTPELADEVQLAVTELASNVIKHVGEGVAATVVMERGDDRIRVELHDKSDRLPALAAPDCGTECGRGLHLLAAMAIDWGTLPTGTGKAVWCELPLTTATRVPCPRVRRATTTLDAYRTLRSAPPIAHPAATEETATDLIADLLHWLADRGSNPDDILDRAQTHFEAEASADQRADQWQAGR